MIIDQFKESRFHSFYVHWGGKRRLGFECQLGEWGYDLRLFTPHRSWLLSRRGRGS